MRRARENDDGKTKPGDESAAFGDKREPARDAENQVGEIGCRCILTSRREVAMRSDSPRLIYLSLAARNKGDDA